ncbi:MAG: hypothetical protein P8X92_07670, partial [Dehalococcoidia bacterium]
KELHQGNDLNRSIKPEVKRILDTGGTFTLVLFADLTACSGVKRTAFRSKADTVPDESGHSTGAKRTLFG